jgi:hypothetical protein
MSSIEGDAKDGLVFFFYIDTRLPYCAAIFYNLIAKSQRGVVNACGNRMCKRALQQRLTVYNMRQGQTVIFESTLQ